MSSEINENQKKAIDVFTKAFSGLAASYNEVERKEYKFIDMDKDFAQQQKKNNYPKLG